MMSTFFTVVTLSILLPFGSAQAFKDAFTGSEAQQVKSMMTSEMPFHPSGLSPMARMRFKCPRDLVFAFECECYFVRIGRLELNDGNRVQCEKRQEEIDANPPLGPRIAMRCRKAYKSLMDPLTADQIRTKRDEIFQMCPGFLRQICPTDPDYKVFECQCFLVFNGEIPDIFNPGVCDPFDFDSLSSSEINAISSRCMEVRRFKDFAGSFVGLTIRLCTTIDQVCCAAL